MEFEVHTLSFVHTKNQKYVKTVVLHREAKQGHIQNNHMYPQLSSNEALSYYNLLYANSAKLNSRETHHTLCLMENAYIGNACCPIK